MIKTVKTFCNSIQLQLIPTRFYCYMRGLVKICVKIEYHDACPHLNVYIQKHK